MAKQLLSVGIAGGLAMAIGLALLFSAITTHSTAQMRGYHGMAGGTMGPGMMATQSAGMPWQSGAMFNANGMSTVDNVQITGVSITDIDEVKVNVMYDGSETSPAITVVAIAGMMQSNSGMMGQGMMYGGNSYGITWANNTEWQQWHNQMAQWHSQINSTQWAQMQGWHNQMMAQGAMGPGSAWWSGTSTAGPGQFTTFQPQTGSSVVRSGWASETTVTIKLEGNGSAYDSGAIHVMVFPLTS